MDAPGCTELRLLWHNMVTQLPSPRVGNGQSHLPSATLSKILAPNCGCTAFPHPGGEWAPLQLQCPATCW